MRTLTARELLQIWENHRERPVLHRMLHLLSAACGIPEVNTIAQWSIGERDARLLQLREWMFGSKLVNLARCPECSEMVEWEMSTDMLKLQPFGQKEPAATYLLQCGAYHLQYRLVNSLDVLSLIGQGDVSFRPEQLLLDCVLEAKMGDQTVSTAELPAEVLAALDRQVEQEDPQAHISMAMTCPACGHNWSTIFDIMGYLWAEIDAWAKRLFQEVYILARAFGWSERDIIEMSPRRRSLYLSMLRS